MLNGFGSDRFGLADFGNADFYYTQIIENIPKFYLYDEVNNEIVNSEFYKFIIIFEDYFNHIFDLTDQSKQAGIYLWDKEIIEYISGEIIKNSKAGDKWIKADDNVYNDLAVISYEDGRFIRILNSTPEESNLARYIYKMERAGFGVEDFGEYNFGNPSGVYLYVIPPIKTDIYSCGFGESKFGLDTFGEDSIYGNLVAVKRYDLLEYMSKNYGIELDKMTHSDERITTLINSMYISSVRGHNKGYEFWAELYNFLFELYEVYKIFNFRFFKDIDQLYQDPPRYLFDDKKYKDYYYKNYFIDSNGREYIIQEKDKYLPLMLVFDEFECDPPSSSNSSIPANYPSLDVFGWMVNTENPDNNPTLQNPKTYKDDFYYYSWVYCSNYYSKYAGLIIKLTQIQNYYPELSANMIERLIYRILNIKPIHIKFLSFILDLLPFGGNNISVSSILEIEDLTNITTNVDVLAHYDTSGSDSNYYNLDERPRSEFTET